MLTIVLPSTSLNVSFKVSLLDDATGSTKDDANLLAVGGGEDGGDGGGGGWDAVGTEVLRRYEAGETLSVTIFSSLGREVVVGVREVED